MSTSGLPRVHYLTADGLLEPLGYSQIVRVVEGLAARGWRYRITSLEKPRDLANEERVAAVRARLARAGVEWRWFPYEEGGGARAAARNEWVLAHAAIEAGRRREVTASHARSYHGAMAALAAKVASGVPYVFDTRSYWFDERLEEGRWFTSPLRLAVARGLEHQLFTQAAAVVTLTELQAEDVRSGKFGPPRGRPIVCITTSADFDDFRRRRAEMCTAVPTSLRSVMAGKTVVGIVGSINRSYLVEETLELATLVLERSPRAHLLVLSGQRAEYERRLQSLGVDLERVTVSRADHEAMPQWLSLMTWGLLLLQANSPAKRASMPTKLGEFLAAGVRPVQFGCNAEVAEWVRRTGSGVVLQDVTSEALRAVADVMLERPVNDAELELARQRAAPHFSLAAAVERYDSMLSDALGKAGRRPTS
jgi:hypothetical protein